MKIKSIDKIKVPTISAHAAAVEYHKGQPVHAWFGGTREGAPDVKIYIQYKEKIRPLSLATPEGAQLPAWNPVFFTAKEKLYLFFKVGRFCDCWQTFLVELIIKGDELAPGKAMLLPAGFNGPVKSRPLLEGDTLYCGSSVETAFNWVSYLETFTLQWLENGQVYLDETLRTDPIKLLTSDRIKGIIQPTLWREDDKIHMMFRSSRDSGKIWYTHYRLENGLMMNARELELPNPNSGVDVVAHSNGIKYLIHNPSATQRTPLTISRMSQTATGIPVLIDDLVIDKVDTEGGYFSSGTPEVSYPYAVETPDGDIEVVYTYRRKYIKSAIIEV